MPSYSFPSLEPPPLSKIDRLALLAASWHDYVAIHADKVSSVSMSTVKPLQAFALQLCVLISDGTV